jgi:DNA ligase (NAD+)
MTSAEAKEKIQELTDQINHHNDLYYKKAKLKFQILNSINYWNELQNLEKEFPDLRLADSPTQRVGGTITKEFASVIHQYPMLSLGNTYSAEELN